MFIPGTFIANLAFAEIVSMTFRFSEKGRFEIVAVFDVEIVLSGLGKSEKIPDPLRVTALLEHDVYLAHLSPMVDLCSQSWILIDSCLWGILAPSLSVEKRNVKPAWDNGDACQSTEGFENSLRVYIPCRKTAVKHCNWLKTHDFRSDVTT